MTFYEAKMIDAFLKRAETDSRESNGSSCHHAIP